MFFVHGEGCVGSGSQYTGCQIVGKIGDVLVVCRGELDESCEVSRKRVKGSNVGETKLAKCVL